MTKGDSNFLRAIGIEPYDLDDVEVQWKDKSEPEFIPPKTIGEYLNRFPHGISEATRAVANEMGLRLTDGSLEDLAQEITQMFLDFVALDLEDVVAMFPLDKFFRPRAGEHGSEKFERYVRFRVKAAVQAVLKLDPSRGWNGG